jgi:hypothetical protein
VAFSLCYPAFCQLLGLLRTTCRPDIDKNIELMELHHEVRILEHQAHGRVRYRLADRAILAVLSRLLSRR